MDACTSFKELVDKVLSLRRTWWTVMASALEAGFLRFVIGHGGRSNAPADRDDRGVGFGRVHPQLTNGLNKVEELPALHHKALAAD